MLQLKDIPHEGRAGFFVVYGPNNVGKSAALDGVRTALDQLRLPVRFVKYPVYDHPPTGPAINAYLREGNPKKWTPTEAQENYAQNRRDFEPVVIANLLKGRNVLAEDYVGTGMAWGLTFDVPMETLELFNNGLLKPDMSILVYGRRFFSGIETGHIHEDRNDGIWERNHRIHLELADLYGWTKVSNEGRTVQEVAEHVSMLVSGYITTRQGVLI